MDFFKRHRDEFSRLMKFGVTGGMNTLIDIAVYTLLAVWLGLNVYVAQFFGYFAGMLNSYLVNRSWTFRSTERFFSVQLIKFLVTNLIMLAVSLLLLSLFMNIFQLGKLTAKLVATVITLVLSFVLNRLWVFRE